MTVRKTNLFLKCNERHSFTQQVEEADWVLLWGLIVYHGGRCQGNLTPHCTHLITAALEGVCRLKNPFFFTVFLKHRTCTTKFVYLVEEVEKKNPVLHQLFCQNMSLMSGKASPLNSQYQISSVFSIALSHSATLLASKQ